MKKYRFGLFHGRFQHIHKGHQKIIDRMLNECKKAVLLVGNCQTQRTKKNPFNILERIEIINKIYGETNLVIGFFPDLEIPRTKKEYKLFGEWIISFCKYYTKEIPDVIYSGDEVKTEWLYEKHKIKLIKISRKEIPITSTKIRKFLYKNKKREWKKFTDKKIHSFYNKLRRISLDIYS